MLVLLNVTKNKGTIECDKSTITCNVGTIQCNNGTVKCEKKKKKKKSEPLNEIKIWLHVMLVLPNVIMELLNVRKKKIKVPLNVTE